MPTSLVRLNPSIISGHVSSSLHFPVSHNFVSSLLVNQTVVKRAGGRMELRDAANQQRRSCIMLGKRPHCYYENRGDVLTGSMKRERVTSHVVATVPRCQVDGCGKALIEGKEYHRRHKVCEQHSKAPVVLVLGSQQRFCQQCSRFHSVSEFDDSKRSCRRRLAGHNERRRKSTQDSIVRSSSLESTIMGGGIRQISSASSARALSLLSSNTSPCLTTTNLSSLSRAALLELIAENRAGTLAGQLFPGRSNWRDTGTECSTIQSYFPQEPQLVPSQEPSLLTSSWNELQEDRTQVTLDLMQIPPGPSFDFVSGRNKNKEEEECCEFWKSLEGTHVV
ncbi:hypothetical protein J5N97_018512 [Dioscorea zingiberensis]|uniref:SBP-type domain-containing protein n=1 Tax=Dioscorea zingiberensis TaxID=325984 RepID=A0A9D5CCZ2_9LILI|nr:hypothetical protein J5N97_018512 [Dioscorea zingiberensis]